MDNGNIAGRRSIWPAMDAPQRRDLSDEEKLALHIEATRRVEERKDLETITEVVMRFDVPNYGMDEPIADFLARFDVEAPADVELMVGVDQDSDRGDYGGWSYDGDIEFSVYYKRQETQHEATERVYKRLLAERRDEMMAEDRDRAEYERLRAKFNSGQCVMD